MIKRIAVLAAVAAVASVMAVAPASADDDVRTYEVTITNLTKGQPLTPALAATHRFNTGFFRLWRPASSELQQIAENGNLDPMLALIQGSNRFFDHEVKTGATVPPILPGETVTFEIDGTSRYRFLSWASMLICTNDGFTGVNRLWLPSRVGKEISRYTWGYDAGTEINTEDWDNLVPPCAQLTGFGDQGGTGTTDPTLAENGRIRFHRGIRGIADLERSVHGWRGPVAKITIERTS